ncbi:hypothetical protein A2733_01225 [Candidatus Nomurabacteria bacterium RIFCSPHIGHO2_01_FULL_40_20]|uniref:Uncharacterized protein n=1 Tax=Candidatus Nomurabacteria bacterium RIFCSPHIGHO2_01_FULL_40_20 TaxID=1801738 RepID=A0A1F6V3S0_9BACT|nr:MAG: hypothetical protein A2733_01225 [Candidatus Nomurabacteria bacterium RIFCSPHIGHO2_01_FULL_40_20]
MKEEDFLKPENQTIFRKHKEEQGNKSRQMRIEESENLKRDLSNEGTFSIPEDPVFKISFSLPSSPVGLSNNMETILGYIVHKVEGLGTVRIEYIGHALVEEGKTNTHIFYFRSQVRDLFGHITQNRFYPSSRTEHPLTMGGNTSINKWFKKLRDLELGKNKIIGSPEWEREIKNGYYKYICNVSKS